MEIDLDLAAFWLRCVATVAGALGATWAGVVMVRAWIQVPAPRIVRRRLWEEIPEADEGQPPVLPIPPRRPLVEYLVRRECPCGYARKDALPRPASGCGLCPECNDWTLETRTICRVRWPRPKERDR